jgi:hypothetical protein
LTPAAVPDGTADGGGISESSGVSEEPAAAGARIPSALKELHSNSKAARNEQLSTPRRTSLELQAQLPSCPAQPDS